MQSAHLVQQPLHFCFVVELLDLEFVQQRCSFCLHFGDVVHFRRGNAAQSLVEALDFSAQSAHQLTQSRVLVEQFGVVLERQFEFEAQLLGDGFGGLEHAETTDVFFLFDGAVDAEEPTVVFDGTL